MELTDKRLEEMVDAIYGEIRKKIPQITSLNIESLVRNLIAATISWLEVQGYLDIEKINK
ncbi:MAG: hypothetical protein RLZZ532_3817 [Cyanobacteriota bacterium]|jgi:hypothetical protein|nr:MAG: hypothetical protein [uncultured cyanophage]